MTKMNPMKYLGGLAVALLLAACGGGSPESIAIGTPPPPPVVIPPPVVEPPPVRVMPAFVEVLTSSNSLLSAGAEVVVTAVVKNAANVAMPNQSVAFSATSGSLLSAVTETDASGVATARLTAGSNKSVRNITVSVTAGTAVGNVVVPVTGTRLTVTGVGTLKTGEVASYTVRTFDSSGNPIANASVAVSSTLSNGISLPTVTTDATGNGSFIYTANNSGVDALSVAALGTTAQTPVVVSGIDFSALSPAPAATIPVTSPQTITVRYRSGGVGVAGQTVNFISTRGTFVTPTVMTNAQGDASASLSSTTAGPATVSAFIAGVGQVNLQVQFVATVPASLLLQVNPNAVLPNPIGATTNQTTVEAVVRDAAGNAVANRQVNFVTLQDVSNGTLQPGSAVTDSNGRAQVQFIPGGNSTPSDGVKLQATVAGTTVRGDASLTVNGQALFINLGFGNTISNVDETTYSKLFSVYVTDANGNAVGNQQVTLVAIPDEYYKGTLEIPTGTFGASWAYAGVPAACPNEDLNANGILNADEDFNGDGVLTPGNPAVPFPGRITTDSQGRATFELRYGEQFAPWVNLKLSARASVGGTESITSIKYLMVGSASDFNSSNPPAGVRSPYGVSANCSSAQ
jgi:hypothetical protein